MADLEQEVKKLKQQLASAKGRNKSAKKNARKGQERSTACNHPITYTAAVAAVVGGAPGNPEVWSIGDSWDPEIPSMESLSHFAIAPIDFVESWSRHLTRENNRIVVMYAFKVTITAGECSDIMVKPSNRTFYDYAQRVAPLTVAAGAGRILQADLTGSIEIPAGESMDITFSIVGSQVPIEQIKKSAERMFKAGVVTGRKTVRGIGGILIPRNIFNYRNHNTGDSFWKAEVQEVARLPFQPMFQIFVDGVSFREAPFRHLTRDQNYKLATVKWKSIHYLPF